MKHYVVIFRNRTSSQLKAVTVEAEHGEKAKKDGALKLPKNSHFEYMWHKEVEKPKVKGKGKK
jgi:hypothetical protein